mmetsp:Transcript_7704/g.7125  ORF Transcript_7704/g.7125 Transcript_7704/m.7125 type:complete len:85 (-) Transcript_7704:31-285(-)
MICEEFSSSKFINVELMKYAMDLCDKEEEKKKKRLEKLRKKNSFLMDPLMRYLVPGLGHCTRFTIFAFLITLLIYGFLYLKLLF